MEEVGAQVVSPIFIPQSLPSLFREAPPVPKKRDLAWQNPNFNPNPSPNWNPKLYDWDSVRFAVRPSASKFEGRRNSALTKGLEEAGESLSLKLGGEGALVASVDQTSARPSKKVRSGSPGSGGGTGASYPMCQVDDCKADLSNAKDYHKRHKVCEVHSKMTKALVGKQMQRFCQQCSRFHPLSEFDEGKRSCRRRLAGHNRRRRKTQPEDTSSQLLSPGNKANSANSNLDIVKLLAMLARLQGNGADKVATGPLISDKDQVNQIINKIHSLRAATSASRFPVPGGFDLNISQVSEQPSFEQSTKINGNLSTMDLLAVLSAALGASAPGDVAALSQASCDSSGSDKSKIISGEPVIDTNSLDQLSRIFPSSEVNKITLKTQFKVSKDTAQESRPTLPLQLFSSGEDESPPKMGSTRKYLSSESRNPMDDRSPSSSPPVAQKLFPLHSVTESMKHERMSICREENASVITSLSHSWIAPLDLFDLFKESEKQVVNGAAQNLSCQAGYTSSSGSDHSPSSSNSNSQDRTGRIIFKLFDKDPSNFPGALRSQILNWLSNSPSEMESYIRPGCVVLSIYASMACSAWDELERNLIQRISSLVQCSDSEFWRKGRFLVRTSRQLASYKDGKIRLCKPWKTWRAPEVTYVSPIAVVNGQETSFILRGRNLTAPGTRIHCTYMGGYVSKEVSASTHPGTIYDCFSMESFNFHGKLLDVFGRCFIEVENGFKGNSFPVVIADATICKELRVLESELEGDTRADDVCEDQVGLRSREDVLHFLNELGWLFQRRNSAADHFLTNFSCKRFNFLLTFSVERDWIAVVKTLLDMLVERSVNGDASLVQESLEMLQEIQLLSRAVRRKCRKMVSLLLNYFVTVSTDDSKVYLFPPNVVGPGGITPLHLAASTQDSEDMVDALTDDPQELGLKCWDSLLDENGQYPFMYASLRNNHSYNELVERKLADKKNGQISVLVGDQEVVGSSQAAGKSCARCANRFRPILRTRGLLYRPYMHSMLAIAAVCVCVCLLMRGMPTVNDIAPFMWENLDYGPS